MSLSCCFFGKPVTSKKAKAADTNAEELKRVVSATSALSIATSSVTSGTSTTVPSRCTPRAGEISSPAEIDPVIAAAIANAQPLAPLSTGHAKNPHILAPPPIAADPAVAPAAKQKKPSIFTFGYKT